MDTISASVLAVMAVIAGVFALLGWRSYHARVRHEMRHEHDLLVQSYSPALWEGVRHAWQAVRQGRNDLDADLQGVLRSAGPAPGIHERTEPLEYAPHSATPLQDALWKLAIGIYPPETKGDRTRLLDNTLIDTSTATLFLDARSALCGFWEQVGKPATAQENGD